MPTSNNQPTNPQPDEDIERIELQVPLLISQPLRRAAEAQGIAIEKFILNAAFNTAMSELQDSTNTLRLNHEQSQRLIEALENPPEPNKALRNAFRRSQQLID